MKFTTLLAGTLLFSSLLFSCSENDPELPSFPVDLKLGGTFVPDNRVVEITSAWVVMGDLTIYGMDREAAGYLFFSPLQHLKHAGHNHGEAEMETGTEATFLINLLDTPATVATNMVTEGHYFDGKVRLRPMIQLYEPLFPGGDPVPETHPLWGETLSVEGYVTRDGTVVPFSINGSMELLVTGLEYAGTVWEGGTGSITTLLDLNRLLGAVDWEMTTLGDEHITINEENNPQAWEALQTALWDYTAYYHLETEPLPDD